MASSLARQLVVQAGQALDNGVDPTCTRNNVNRATNVPGDAVTAWMTTIALGQKFAYKRAQGTLVNAEINFLTENIHVYRCWGAVIAMLPLKNVVVGVPVQLGLGLTRSVQQNGGISIQSTEDLTNLEYVLTVVIWLGGATLIPHGRPKGAHLRKKKCFKKYYGYEVPSNGKPHYKPQMLLEMGQMRCINCPDTAPSPRCPSRRPRTFLRTRGTTTWLRLS